MRENIILQPFGPVIWRIIKDAVMALRKWIRTDIH
jgi:hypothetical protein